MVTLMLRCPAMTWAMCGGSPVMIASVMNILRKSCGVKISGCPAASASPVRPSAVLSMFRMVPEERGRALPDVLMLVITGSQRDLPVRAGEPGDDRGEHVGEVRRDDQEPLGVGL